MPDKYAFMERELASLEAGGALARALAEQVRLWRPVQRRIFAEVFGGTLAADNCAFLHDPLTVLALDGDAPLRFEELPIVATIERGTLRTHEAAAELEMGTPMRVATGVDGAAAAARIAERIARL